MKLLLEKLGVSIDHLKCLDQVFIDNNEEYRRIDSVLNSDEFLQHYNDISRELYAGGKTGPNSTVKLNRQMILGDVIEYIFSGRAYYYAAKSENQLKHFFKLIIYTVNQMLLYDTITVDPDLRKLYIEKLETTIPKEILYEKEGDDTIAESVKNSKAMIWGKEWTKEYDRFVDSILPKTLGAPKELIVFAEFIRINIGLVVPLLLVQRIFGDSNPLAPPDFLIMKSNKDIYGIEVGYKKELQSREFSIRTSIPTFAIDLKNNLHNRCPICGHNILYCDVFINHYAENTLRTLITNDNGVDRILCYTCPSFDHGNCKFSNYYGRADGKDFNGNALESAKKRHYHASCVRNLYYRKNRSHVSIYDDCHKHFFAQIPEIEGLEDWENR